MDEGEVLGRLRSMANPANVAGMARFGINSENTLGVSVTELRKLAREIGKDHGLALKLWESGIHEARILASIIDDPRLVTESQMESWVRDFNSWDVCDEVIMNLFKKTPFARDKALEWSARKGEFVKRAGFVLMTNLTVGDKKAGDSLFETFLPLIKREATDGRNNVKKAVNWALRQIGKRNIRLNQLAIKTAEEIRKLDDRTARWIASDALRELRSDAVKKRLKAKDA
ncbi:MAG: DNA alkylation repair protein [Chloroflexota bacterium]